MARMSIDDKVSRDPRITVLASLLGWSRRETVGCLVMDVWPIAYDQETHLVSERIVDAAAGLDGFAAKLIEAELATRDRSGKIRIAGARERIEYLDHKRESARLGGLKSGESRRQKAKQTPTTPRAEPQALGNPPSPDPVPVPDPSPVPVLDREREVARTPRTPWQKLSDWWSRMRAVHTELRREGIQPNRADLSSSFAGVHERNMVACERVLRESGVPPEDHDARVEHVLAVAAAEARRERHLDWFIPTKLWDPERFARALDTTVEQASKPRGSTPARPGTGGALAGVQDAREQLRKDKP